MRVWTVQIAWWTEERLAGRVCDPPEDEPFLQQLDGWIEFGRWPAGALSWRAGPPL